MREKSKITVDRTGVTTYYAVNLNDIDYTVMDMYDANADYTERAVLALQTEQEPTVKKPKRISEASADFEVDS